MFRQVRGPGLLVLGALSLSCGRGSFALGEGKDCIEGTLNCVCDSAKGCEAPLVCRGDLCVEGSPAKESTTTTGNSTDEDNPQDPTGHGPDSTSGTQSTSSECSGDADCPKPTKPCAVAICKAGTCIQDPAPDNAPCGDSCIPMGTCAQGSCQGQEARFLSEDFSNGQGKWKTTSPNLQLSLWKVGEAKVSECDDVGQGEDPREDHSEGSDNMLAGTKIGGCVEGRTTRDWDCLLSPLLDISNFKGKLEFSYWRHLHTPPNIVQGLKGAHYRVFAVFNEKTPVIVEEGYDAGINDSNWHRVSHLLDADDNTLTVSFCFETGYGARSFAGWSVDDVRVRAKGCDPEL